ncbi:MAG: hypothetical protein NT157_06325, partial [Candidatus Micrarchaeota archaeon]|nr:hypothetical protein [Candidatus Micrarchaeota archaeon]
MADVKRIIATLALAVPAFFLVWAAYGAFGSLASNGATSQNMISGGLCIAIPLLVTILVYALLRSEFKDFQLQGRHYVLAIIFVVLSILLIKSFESIHFGDPAF